MNFEEISGQRRQIEVLKRGINSSRINHFYLFEGDKGTNKLELALAFSKAILCKAEGDRPCKKCSSCIKFQTENHPDFKMLLPSKGFIKKEDVENMVEDISILPFEAGKKVFLIDDFHLTKPETQNLLLKTLEEPPSYVVILILTSNSNKILPTILSRCQRLVFFKENMMEDLREGEDFYKIRDEIIALVDDLLKGNHLKAFTSIDFFTSKKDRIDEILDIMIYFFRDLAIYKEIGASRLLLNGDSLDKLELQSSIDIDRIYDIIYKIEETKTNIGRNVNFNLSIETMLLNIGGI